MKKRFEMISIVTILLLIWASLAGVLSIDFSHSYDAVNQYGETVRMYGYGIYAHDTYFKAPISIGTDISILIVVIPLFVWSYIRSMKNADTPSRLKLVSVYAVSLYYAANIAFGITYNTLHLVYIALFAFSLFGMLYHITKLDVTALGFNAAKGVKIFLVLTGVALIVAWLPDIIPTVLTGNPLTLIGVYTTEVTYVLDMGIIGPLCFICLYLLNKQSGLGTLSLAVILKLCIIVGTMIIFQTACQIASGIDIELPVLITKASSFVVLGAFAYYFNRKLYKKLVLT